MKKNHVIWHDGYVKRVGTYPAEDKADIGPTMEWDTAAGQAIVEQAGRKVLNVQTREPLKYNKENLLNPWFIVRKDELLRTMPTI